MTNLLTSVWFYLSVLGVVYAAYLGYTAYFARNNKTHARNNEDRRERLETATAIIVTIVLVVERIAQLADIALDSLPSDTDDGWAPFVFAFMVFFFWGAYTGLLILVDYVASIISLGMIEKRRLNRRRAKAQRVQEDIAREKKRQAEFERKLMLNALHPSH